ncbi:hypothetical protein ACNF49_39835 [Actinomadura sp. ATCC 39365]
MSVTASAAPGRASTSRGWRALRRPAGTGRRRTGPGGRSPSCTDSSTRVHVRPRPSPIRDENRGRVAVGAASGVRSSYREKWPKVRRCESLPSAAWADRR